MKSLVLEVEPIPESTWHISLANILPKEVWNTIRREVYSKAHYACEICNTTDVEVHCHEQWKWDDKKRTQSLVELKCVCKDCHNVKHWGRTVTLVHAGTFPSSYLEQLTDHFCEVNNCSRDFFELHRVVVGKVSLDRSRYDYKVDFGHFSPDKVVRIWTKHQKS